MNKAKFTSGPWKFNAHNGYITDCTKAENEIAMVNLYDWDRLGMGYKNAHLVAAAPSMYEFIETHMGGHPEAERLLAKARGEHE